MTKEAADVLQHFYLQLRKHSNADGSPITARQLESLVRLVEARARLELREEISKQDAKVRDMNADGYGVHVHHIGVLSTLRILFQLAIKPNILVDKDLSVLLLVPFTGCGRDYERVIV